MPLPRPGPGGRPGLRLNNGSVKIMMHFHDYLNTWLPQLPQLPADKSKYKTYLWLKRFLTLVLHGLSLVLAQAAALAFALTVGLQND